MKSLTQAMVVGLAIIGFGAVAGLLSGCGNTSSSGSKMSSMNGGKMGSDKMGDGKMSGDKMNEGKMGGDKMGGDKMK